jgi:hypothetical protein
VLCTNLQQQASCRARGRSLAKPGWGLLRAATKLKKTSRVVLSGDLYHQSSSIKPQRVPP